MVWWCVVVVCLTLQRVGPARLQLLAHGLHGGRVQLAQGPRQRAHARPALPLPRGLLPGYTDKVISLRKTTPTESDEILVSKLISLFLVVYYL